MEHLRAAVANGNARHISTDHYGPAEVKTLLEGIYHEKCAYCESTVKQVASLQVEHYRPKNGVSDDETHPGYFWLSVEWSNLVLGCPACNGQGAKGNKFPISGVRVLEQNPFDENGNLASHFLKANRSPLLDEMPHLLHPEIDEPKEHLKFTAFANIEWKTERGEKTIEICKLNRDPLILARQTVVNDFLEQCNIIFLVKHTSDLSDDIADTLLKAQLKLLKTYRDTPDKPYTSFIAFLLENPESCILPRIESIFQPDFRRIFEQFRHEELEGV